jgi:hypothetical protein
MTITPINQENSGRFNRRSITVISKLDDVYNHIFTGVTDTGKSVYINVWALSSFINDENSLTVAVRYTSVDAKAGYTFCSSLGWGNYYIITAEELEQIKKL